MDSDSSWTEQHYSEEQMRRDMEILSNPYYWPDPYYRDPYNSLPWD